jgi:hypothetical protein
MDESALKTLLDNLDRSQSSLHHWLHFWTFLVVVGVVLEVVFVVWEYAEDLHDFRRGIVQPPEKPSLLLLVLGLLGAGLVAVGVAGELYIDVQAGKVETDIRNANELRISLLTKEADDAKTSALGAASAADRAKASADAAGTAADRAVRKAREAEEYATPRSISGKQTALIRKRIQSLKGHKIVFFGNFNDTEISDLGNQMSATIDNGIMDITIGVWQAGMVTPAGMKFGYGKDRKADVELIVSALDEAGVEKASVLRKKASMVGIPDDWLTITFGAKH